MCKHHDWLHFPVLMREVALELALGDPRDRDLFLQIALYSGMRDLVDSHGQCIPVDRKTRVLSRLEAERTRLFKVAQDSFDRIHDAWEKEAKAALEEVPF